MKPARGGIVFVALTSAAVVQGAHLAFHDSAQQVFRNSPSNPLVNLWNLTDASIRDSTSNLIFDTVNSFLQHWPNTRYRNGHNIVPATVPVGTLIYHGTNKEEIPKVPEWLATDPEHSYLFCREMNGSGCWHLTLVATRPLKVLYFDGSSAAKMEGGPMDSQDLVGWGEIKPDWVFQERKRVKDLCEWGKQYDLDGFVRMEMDFEIMLCDFTAGVKTVSFLNLKPPGMGHGPRLPPQPPSRSALEAKRNSVAFRVVESGSWHNRFPGETRVKLDYSRVVSFYDEATFPSLRKARAGQERWDHRLAGISTEDTKTMYARLDEVLKGLPGDSPSGVDWQTLFITIAQRYAERLEVLQYILNATLVESDEARAVLHRAHNHIGSMLAPYNLHSAVPPKPSPGGYTWAEPVFEQCATTHTGYLDSDALTLTRSERLLLNVVKDVAKEICRVVVQTWAEGVELGLLEDESEDASVASSESQDVVVAWKNQVESLMTWLDWSYWIRCKPACAYEELCYLPTWPFFGHRPRSPRPGSDRYPTKFLNWVWGLEPSFAPPGGAGGDDDTWLHPQPRCIRRMEPFNIIE